MFGSKITENGRAHQRVKLSTMFTRYAHLLTASNRFTYHQDLVKVEDVPGRLSSFASECSMEALNIDNTAQFEEQPRTDEGSANTSYWLIQAQLPAKGAEPLPLAVPPPLYRSEGLLR